MTQYILDLVHWVGGHPNLAGLLVALVACLESLAFVGLVVPGAVLMVGAGALVGIGALNFWSTLAWAVGGAIAGDGVSYWLGHRYRESLKKLEWIRLHPDLLARGERFLQQHGGKSILLARFVGPVRPVVPIVAGTLGMSPLRFYLNNVLSALVWAPAHLLPGMAFGASLALAGQVAGRLAFGIALGLAFVWLMTWAVRITYQWLSEHAQAWTGRLQRWSNSHSRLSWLIGDLFDPQRAATRTLLLWLVVLISGNWLFWGVVEDVVNKDPIVYAGRSIYHFLQQLRTPIGDHFLIAVTELGDVAVIAPVVVIVLAWLIWKRAWRDAKYWLAAVMFGVLAVESMKFVFHVPRPIQIYTGNEVNSFPSGHATISTVVYGFLAVLCARSFAQKWRWIPYAIAALLITAIAVSRLYLGAHWFADVIAGMSFGLAWIAVLSIARNRHSTRLEPISGLAPIIAVGLLIVGSVHIHDQHARDVTRYMVQTPIHQLNASTWWDRGWQTLPPYRIDLQGEFEQPLNFQYAGSLELLQMRLKTNGWGNPIPLTLGSSMHLLLSNPKLSELPVLPQLNEGQPEKLVMVRHIADEAGRERQYILRLWPSNITLGKFNIPVWVGSIEAQEIRQLPMLSFVSSSGDYAHALSALISLQGSLDRTKVVNRNEDGHSEADQTWDGTTLLISTMDLDS